MTDHKKYLEYLKKHDPISYYEMTSNPTGVSGSDYSGLIGFVFAVLVIVLVVLGFKIL